MESSITTYPPFGPTIPPQSLAMGAHNLRRYTFRPWGRGPAAEGKPSFTLSLYDTARSSDGPGSMTFIGYRLYLHPAGTRRGVVVFERDDFVPEPGMDLSGIAIAVLDALTTRPGDVAGEATAELSPSQLDFVVRWGADLRRAARERLAWSPEQLRDLRADIATLYTVRRDGGGQARHAMKLGVVEAKGGTLRECKEALSRALANHVSAEPEFRQGARTGILYAFYPQGGDWVIQALHPGRPDAQGGLLGQRVQWPMDRAGARESLEGVLARLEASQPSVPAAWRRSLAPRPSARAPRKRASTCPRIEAGAA